MISLTVTARDSSKSAEALRRGGVLPAVFYGPKEPSTSIAISYPVFERVWKEAGETTVLSLTGVGEPKQVLIQEVAVNPVTGKPEHVDFYVFEKGKKIEIKVPIEFVGVAAAEKEGLVTVKVLHEIEIRVSPIDLPKHLTVDISHLAVDGDSITVSQVAIPESAEFVTDPKEVVVSITEQKIVEEVETKPPTDEELAAQAAAEGGIAAEGGAEAEKEPKKEREKETK